MTHWLDVQNNLTLYGIKVAITVVFIFVLNIILKRLLNIAIEHSTHTKTPWDDIAWAALSLPLRVYFWALGLIYLCYALFNWMQWKGALSFLFQAFQLVTLAVLIWFVFRFIRRAEQYFVHHFQQMKTNKIDPEGLRAISRLLQISVVIITVLMVLGVLHIPIAGLLTFGGIGAAAIAFGSKDILANFAGGFMIYFNRNFSVGDWIYSPDRQIEGTVEYIGWRQTCIRSFDKRPLYVPNSLFSDIVVVNASRMSNRRILQTIGVRYDDAPRLKEILTKVQAMLESHPAIDHKAITMAYISEFDDSSINFVIYAFTKTTKWAEFQTIQSDVLLQVEEIVRSCDAECAFPTTTLHIPEGVVAQVNAKK